MITLNIDPTTFDGDNNPSEVNIDDIVLINPQGNWHLYNHGSLELTKNCDKEYLNLWEFPIESKNCLIIGGGDYQIASALIDNQMSNITLIDPYSYMYKDFHEFYLNNKSYSSSLYYNLINSIYLTFKNFIETLKNSHKKFKNIKYDLVCIDISEPILGITDEIYCEQFFIDLLNLNTKYYMMYMPPTKYNELVPYLRKYFTMISSKGNFIKDWNEQCDIITFIKKENI